jgi:hypothetical protein
MPPGKKFSSLAHPDKEYRPRQELPRVMVLVSATVNLLCINFLAGRRAKGVTTNTIDSVALLLEKKKLPNDGQPGV